MLCNLIDFNNNLFSFYTFYNLKLAQIQPLKSKHLYSKLLLVREYHLVTK